MKRYFIGIDSDGTAFDSMTIKHRKAFIPAMIRVWKLEEYSEKVSEICEYINLYSPTRGIDRFSGLKVTFDSFKAAGIPVPDYSAVAARLKGKEEPGPAVFPEEPASPETEADPELFSVPLEEWAAPATLEPVFSARELATAAHFQDPAFLAS